MNKQVDFIILDERTDVRVVLRTGNAAVIGILGDLMGWSKRTHTVVVEGPDMDPPVPAYATLTDEEAASLPRYDSIYEVPAVTPWDNDPIAIETRKAIDAR
jgi:hypothetical protein